MSLKQMHFTTLLINFYYYYFLYVENVFFIRVSIKIYFVCILQKYKLPWREFTDLLKRALLGELKPKRSYATLIK